jgi:hypothetical protein
VTKVRKVTGLVASAVSFNAAVGHCVVGLTLHVCALMRKAGPSFSATSRKFPLMFFAAARESVAGTKLPIRYVLATVAIGGKPDMTRTAQFGRK